jgi:hypothetical protein
MSLTRWLRSKSPRYAGRTRRPQKGARCRPGLEVLEDRTVPSTFLVNNVGDSGAGSLRQAILDANAHSGADVIAFDIGSGVQTIQVGGTTGTPLPTVTDSVTIDGTSQPGYGGTPLIELDGTSAGANSSGLVLAASSCTVQGLVINSFTRFGINVQASSNVIQGNYIGVDTTGNMLRADRNGVVVQAAGNTIGGTAAAAGNVIGDGIAVNGDATVIQGNTIGLGADGNTVLGDPNFGIYVAQAQNVVIGGITPSARNVISGNFEYGIITNLDANGLVIQGNYIGTDRTGTVARGNTYYGIATYSADVLIGGLTPTPGTGPGNVISANGSGRSTGGGIGFSGGTGGADFVEGNIIGLDAGGTTALNNFQLVGVGSNVPNVTVGGSATGAGNVISGNSMGVEMGTAANTGDVVEGNYIGTDISGTHAAANGKGVAILASASGSTIGGTTAAARNVISGNTIDGVEISGAGVTNNMVEGNYIGTDVTGNANLGNVNGVVIAGAASGNTIGDVTPGAGNVIAFSNRAGVVVQNASTTGNSIRGNAIHDNGGLGIDLNNDGVTPNDAQDADSGPNNLQNFPVLTSVSIAGGMIQVTGQLDSTPDTTFTLDFYANTLADTSGYGEGQTYLDSTTVATDAIGHASFTATIAAPPAGQQFLSATATDPGRNTSEFSPDTLIAPSSLSGMVFEDFNDDGQVDFGEQGIAGVTVTLTGTDDLGDAICLSRQTGADGTYFFDKLLPGRYILTETQPAGYTQGIDSVGTAGGSMVATDQFFVQLRQGVDGMNYNYGERPPAGSGVLPGQAATIGFWNNRRGQALIFALNGASSSTQLADWLAATLPNIYGAGAGGHNLTGKNNVDVAALFQSDFAQQGAKLDAQVLATALAVYVTNATLDSTQVAAQYGFIVSGDGIGTATVNVGSSGDAFGVANNTTMTVMDLLLATNDQAVDGQLYNYNKTRRDEANIVFSAVNEAGQI